METIREFVAARLLADRIDPAAVERALVAAGIGADDDLPLALCPAAVRAFVLCAARQAVGLAC